MKVRDVSVNENWTSPEKVKYIEEENVSLSLLILLVLFEKRK